MEFLLDAANSYMTLYRILSVFLSLRQIGIAYVSATSSAVAVSVGLNTLVKVQVYTTTMSVNMLLLTVYMCCLV